VRSSLRAPLAALLLLGCTSAYQETFEYRPSTHPHSVPPAELLETDLVNVDRIWACPGEDPIYDRHRHGRARRFVLKAGEYMIEYSKGQFARWPHVWRLESLRFAAIAC
jgi:hypothetical protein